MLSLSSVEAGHDWDRGEVYFRVQSSKCWYSVTVRPDDVLVHGPGVNETYDNGDLPEDLTVEGRALAAVLLFEEQE